MKVFSELGKKINSRFNYLFSHLPHNKAAIFFISMLSTLAVVLLYPIALFYCFPYKYAWIYFKNNPNYSVFCLTILPFAVGLFSVILREFRGDKIPKLWKIWLMIGGLPIIVMMVLPDALDKGPPIQPTHLRLSSSQRLQVIEMEKHLREIYWNNREKYKKSDSNNLRQLSKDIRQCYITGLSSVLDIPKTKVLKFDGNGFEDFFHGFKDFLERASFVAFADLVISLVSAAFVIIIFWFLAVLQLNPIEVSNQQKDAIAWIYIFFFTWFPCRLYSIWHQNFYSLENIGEVFPFTVIVGYLGLLLIASLYAKGILARVVAIFQVVSSTAIGAITYFKPNLLLEIVGKRVREMREGFLVSVEIVILTVLLGIIGQYLEDKNSAKNER
jgi:hypothetical protein